MTDEVEELDEAALEGIQLGDWPTFPPGVGWADGVDIEAEDPALLDSGRRSCVTVTRAGARCGAPPLRGHLLCTPHAGLLDSRAGGAAKAKKRREAEEKAESQVATARLGTRAVVAAALASKHREITSAIGVLADSAASGDVRSAQALIPWINQGLGMPTERLEHRVPGSLDELKALETSQLEELVAARRRQRITLVEAAEEA